MCIGSDYEQMVGFMTAKSAKYVEIWGQGHKQTSRIPGVTSKIRVMNVTIGGSNTAVVCGIESWWERITPDLAANLPCIFYRASACNASRTQYSFTNSVRFRFCFLKSFLANFERLNINITGNKQIHIEL